MEEEEEFTMEQQSLRNGRVVVETPLMKQYRTTKERYPDAILLFRVGDFYETFSDDAILTSSILGITLTRRANGAAQYVELAGFPYHALDTYLPKLIRSGHRVAICDQMEDPKLAKGLVKRDITELVTPAISMNENVLEVKQNNFLAAVVSLDKLYGLALLDISTGEFLVTEGPTAQIEKLLESFKPAELLYNGHRRAETVENFGQKWHLQPLDDWALTLDNGRAAICRHFEVKTLRGFGIEQMPAAIAAAGAVLAYLDITKHSVSRHIHTISRIDDQRFVWMDGFTVRNLELVETHPGGRTLADVIDGTTTPMGGRMLRRWIAFPLKDKNEINARLDTVAYLVDHQDLRSTIVEQLGQIGDLERIVGRVGAGRVVPRDIRQLASGLRSIGRIKQAAAEVDCNALRLTADRLNPLDTLAQTIEHTLLDDLGATQKSGYIRPGASEELDELVRMTHHNKEYLQRMQQTEVERTGIQSLKVGYNSVFGYYFEVRNTYKDKVPREWIRKQTLVSAERYITDELKEYESKILTAEQRIAELEAEIFARLVSTVLEYIDALQTNAVTIARIDCLAGFALVARQNSYSRPEVDDSLELHITQGRHPVIEQMMSPGEQYVPNDIHLDHDQSQIMIITGPNMAGKSALLRQTALIVLMAQIGSFVPARGARIGVVDKIFTRVGASDNISAGDSTFMVEMSEAATILNNMTDRSLVLFDELGRGTSTYDGISIARAIVEYIHDEPGRQAKTLFATHYHELNEMEQSLSRIHNWNVAVSESDGRVNFLRTLRPGGSEHSFGIHVAGMAGMPKSIINRAATLLSGFEQRAARQNPPDDSQPGQQVCLVTLPDVQVNAFIDTIKKLNLDSLTPLEALNCLSDIKKVLDI